MGELKENTKPFVKDDQYHTGRLPSRKELGLFKKASEDLEWGDTGSQYFLQTQTGPDAPQINTVSMMANQILTNVK